MSAEERILVMLHGLGQRPDSWDETLAHLKWEKTWCPDLGELVGKAGGSYEKLYRAFEEACGGIDGALELCGLSIGAVLGLHYAIDHPERVASLVLIGGRSRGPRMLLAIQNAVFALLPERAFQSSGLKKKEMINLCRSMGALDLSSRLCEVRCPVLVLCGERDWANRREAEKLAGGIMGARSGLILGAGHEVNLEKPEALAEKMLRWRQECKG